MIQKAFKLPILSGKFNPEKQKLDFEQQRADLNVPQMIKRVGIETQSPGIDHIASGAYDKGHRMLRQRWHQTTTKLLGKNELDRMCNFSADQIIVHLKEAMENTPEGIDPVHIFMSATLNVTSAFTLGEYHSFGDKEQIKILKWIKNTFENFESLFLINAVTAATPIFAIKLKLQKIFLEWFQPGIYKYRELMFSEVYEFFAQKIKEHEVPLDPAAHGPFMLYIPDNCPYLNAVMEENFRFRPVADSLLHTATGYVELDGFIIPKGSSLQASLLAVKNDPDNFPEAEKFT